jgi:NADP-dependent 3-hydroxy acid dehydrogenase YdfG
VVKTRDLFLDQVYGGILNDREIARAAIEPDEVQQESEEEQEEEDQEEDPDDIEDFSFVFDPEDISDTLNSLLQEMEHVKTKDSQCGIFAIGSDLIHNDGTRSD